MSLKLIIEDYTKRVQELAMQIGQSAMNYNSKNEELKQYLANHNVLIGKHEEAQKVLNDLRKKDSEVIEN